MTEADGKALITPATTPGTREDENNELPLIIPIQTPLPSKSSLYYRLSLPYSILTASTIQVILYFLATPELRDVLRYDPQRQPELWRFVTYMFLHDSRVHLSLNVVVQCLFAMTLEKDQGNLRVLVVYLGGGMLGALGASALNPDLVVGASAGVYALLISHVSHIILNSSTTKHKTYYTMIIAIIVTSDIIYNAFHVRSSKDPIISIGAHVAGAIGGFFLGLILYKTADKSKERVLTYFGSSMLCLVFVVLLLINYQAKKCTKNRFSTSYTFFC